MSVILVSEATMYRIKNKKRKTWSAPDTKHMCLLLELVYTYLMQTHKLVKNRWTGHNHSFEVVDQRYLTEYVCHDHILKSAFVCKHTNQWFRLYIQSELQRVLCSKFTFTRIIDTGLNLFDFASYKNSFELYWKKERLHSLQNDGMFLEYDSFLEQNFLPLKSWMDPENQMVQTLSFNGTRFAEISVTRKINIDANEIMSNNLEVSLTIYTSVQQQVKVELVEVPMDQRWWKASMSEEEEDVEQENFRVLKNSLYKYILESLTEKIRSLFKNK